MCKIPQFLYWYAFLQCLLSILSIIIFRSTTPHADHIAGELNGAHGQKERDSKFIWFSVLKSAWRFIQTDILFPLIKLIGTRCEILGLTKNVIPLQQLDNSIH